MLKDRIREIHWEYWVLGLLCVVGFISTWGYGIYLDQDLELFTKWEGRFLQID